MRLKPLLRTQLERPYVSLTKLLEVFGRVQDCQTHTLQGLRAKRGGNKCEDKEMSKIRKEKDTSSASSRLIAACIESWGSLPADSISVRSIANLAGTSPSAIDYHFGNIERLYVAAQEVALEQAKCWLDQRIAQLQPLDAVNLSLDNQISVIATVMDNWAADCRALAWAAVEAASRARHNGALEPHAAWLRLWRTTWQRIANIIGASNLGDRLFLFHQGEGPLHLLNANRALDRGLLQESLGLLLAPTTSASSQQGRIRRAYIHAHGAQNIPTAVQPKADETRNTVESAAAAILCANGLAALNYRSVAARAGCTLGQVSWVYKSKSQLVEGAFLRLYFDMAMVSKPSTRPAPGIAMEETIEALTSGPQPLLTALNDIVTHIARDKDRATLRESFRVFPDPGAQWLLAWLLDMSEDACDDTAAVFASLCRGIECCALADADAGHSRDLARHVLSGWLAQVAKGLEAA